MSDFGSKHKIRCKRYFLSGIKKADNKNETNKDDFFKFNKRTVNDFV